MLAPLLPAAGTAAEIPASRQLVQAGKAGEVIYLGNSWSEKTGFLTGTDQLFSEAQLGPGDFSLSARLAIRNLKGSAASLQLGRTNHLGFSGGKDSRPFAEGRLFAPKSLLLGTAAPAEGKIFTLEVKRIGELLTATVDGAPLLSAKVSAGAVGPVGFRPLRGTIELYDFSIQGNFLKEKFSVNPRWQKPQNYPLLDISAETARHSIVAAGTAETYQGHPTTVLLPDGRTIYAVWTIGHGGTCGPLAKSEDGGRTWRQLPSPADWSTSQNCPSIYRLTDPQGRSRLIVYAARPAMTLTYSEDEGQTWSPIRSLGLPCVMAFSSIVRLKDGRYLGLYHRGQADHDRPPLEIWQTISADGGLNWTAPRMICAAEGLNPCEPCVFRSPDGGKLVALLRENCHTATSLLIHSEDEGETWSAPEYTAWALTGDRHAARYAPDGRLVVAFRDQAPDSPTRGHFLLWVGTCDDVLNGTNGQYRVKLLHSHAGGDCGYPGLELLPDGTFVATTYIKYAAGPEKNSVVSVRFKLDELDARLASADRQGLAAK